MTLVPMLGGLHVAVLYVIFVGAGTCDSTAERLLWIPQVLRSAGYNGLHALKLVETMHASIYEHARTNNYA